MRKQLTFVALAALAVGLLLLPALFGQNKTEQYSGVLQLTGGIGGGASRPIDIWINRYNTDEDMKGYATLLVEGGPDKLRRALEKEDVGQIAPAGRIGIALAVARKFVDGNKTIIRLATARDMSFLELRYSGRSTDYPYTIVQLELDQNGKGIGSLIAAARVSFNKKKNTYEIESYQHGTTYNRIVNVRRMD